MRAITTTTGVLLLASLSSLAQAEPEDGEPTAPLDPDKAFELSAIGAAAPAAVAGVGALVVVPTALKTQGSVTPGVALALTF